MIIVGAFGLDINRHYDCQAVGSGHKPKRKEPPKPKTTKNKRRMQKASRKANRKKR